MLSMAKKIYVGNMSYNTTEEDLRDLFAQYGTVLSATIIFDRETRRPKGFGFVEMEEDNAAEAAISQLNGQEVGGRNLRVNEAIAKPRPSYNDNRY
jgi:RNA recognition motif-containing protein